MEPNQEAVRQAAEFVGRVNEIILFPFIALLMAIAFLVFLWGCAQYVINANNDQGRDTGRRHIIYGLVGLFVMVSAWAILRLVAATFGLGDQVDCANDPSGSGCDRVFEINTDVRQFDTN